MIKIDEQSYIESLKAAFNTMSFDEVLFVKYKEFEQRVAYGGSRPVLKYFPVLKSYNEPPYNTWNFFAETFGLPPKDEIEEGYIYFTGMWVICEDQVIWHEYFERGSVQRMLSDVVDGNCLSDFVGNELFSNLILGQSCTANYYPISYNKKDLYSAGLGTPQWPIIAKMPMGQDELFLCVLKYHLAPLALSKQQRIAVVQRIQNRYVSQRADEVANTASDHIVETEILNELSSQEWLFHTKSLLAVHAGFFKGKQEESILACVKEYCEQNIHGLERSACYDEVVPIGCPSYSKDKLREIFDWLCTSGTLDIPSDQQDRQFAHFYYIITGKEKRKDLLCKDKFEWEGESGRDYIFVALIKYLYQKSPAKYINWKRVAAVFATPFGPMDAAWAKRALRNAQYHKWKEEGIARNALLEEFSNLLT